MYPGTCQILTNWVNNVYFGLLMPHWYSIKLFFFHLSNRIIHASKGSKEAFSFFKLKLLSDFSFCGKIITGNRNAKGENEREFITPKGVWTDTIARLTEGLYVCFKISFTFVQWFAAVEIGYKFGLIYTQP